jgi:protoporphyrinogen oxidase
MSGKCAIIIGAGPAGLTAAYELLEKTDIVPVVCEMDGQVGGISRTVSYKGNRIDIGGHRFFSKSDAVTQWWRRILPLQGAPARDDIALGRKVPLSTEPEAPDPEKTDGVMLVRSRLSRIFFLRRFFSYPMTLSKETIKALGIVRLFRVAIGYLISRLFPRKEKSLEDFFINRFGFDLYGTFFKDYTRKVWGVDCSLLKPEWGAQRVKGISVRAVAAHALRSLLGGKNAGKVETSLIEQFWYPKLGPGQMWEEVARITQEKGGTVLLNHRVTGLSLREGAVESVEITDTASGAVERRSCDYVFSTAPVKDLIEMMGPDSVPPDVYETASGLRYRDFMTVGLLLRKLRIRNETSYRSVNDIIPDNWIYIQERDVKLGRLQVFNNWSPYMVADPSTVWLGLEYFCNEGDEMWAADDGDFASFAAAELAKIGIIDLADVLDSVVIRMPKAYPAYFGAYERFERVRAFTDGITNLFLIGRNGMHRYNNADHSMLAAMTAVENIVQGIASRENIWSVNTEAEYHESKNAGADD